MVRGKNSDLWISILHAGMWNVCSKLYGNPLISFRDILLTNTNVTFMMIALEEISVDHQGQESISFGSHQCL